MTRVALALIFPIRYYAYLRATEISRVRRLATLDHGTGNDRVTSKAVAGAPRHIGRKAAT